MQGQSKNNPKIAARATRVIDKLCDIGDGRIGDMDAAGIDLQLLSLASPGVEQLDAAETVKLARDSNNNLANAVQRHPANLRKKA